MSKPRKNGEPEERPLSRRAWFWPVWALVLLVGIGNVAVSKARQTTANGAEPVQTQTPAAPVATNKLPVMEVNHAVMVTVELDLGSPVPTIAEGLRQVERRYQPDDGRGRTFAILDAYGEPTPGGKLHMSMHVSTEKPGLGTLVLRR